MSTIFASSVDVGERLKVVRWLNREKCEAALANVAKEPLQATVVKALQARLRRLDIGYQAANQRPACKNCKHGEEVRADRMPPFDTSTWQCVRFSFRTTAMATCFQHQAKYPSTQGASA